MSVTDLDILRAYPDRVMARAVQRMSELYADGPSAEEFAARIEADPAVQRAAAARGVKPAGLVGILIGWNS